MLPKKHFDLLEKEAIDSEMNLNKINSKAVEINDNTIANSSKSTADDDDYSEYDDENYDYDTESEEIVNATSKPLTSLTSNFLFFRFHFVISDHS